MYRPLYHFLCFLLGCLYGWIGDGGHVWSGVLDYPAKQRVWPPGLAWWVLPQFGCGGLILSLLIHSIARRTTNAWKLPAHYPGYGRAMIALMMALGTYLLSSVLKTLHFHSWSISLILTFCTLQECYFLRLHHYKHLYPTFLLAALGVGLGGVAWESSLCHLGVFRYLTPDSGLYVEHWIAQLWIGAVAAAAVAMWRYESEELRSKRQKAK